jgi:hypothetical protein
MLVLINARAYTLWEEMPRAEAVAIDNGRFTAVGMNEDILDLAGPQDLVRDMEGGTLWPGLTDSHIHFQKYALNLERIDCETDSRAECLARVKIVAEKAPEGSWLRGHGWNQNNWAEGFGDARLLDEAAPRNPVYLTAKSLHAGWANTAALKLAGITRDTPDPKDGEIQRNEDGAPTGILIEAAMELVEKAIPEPTVSEVRRALEHAQQTLWALGVTGIHDFDPRSCFMALQEMEQAGTLALRVLKSIPLDDLPHALGLGICSGFGSDLLRIGSLKLFADGALGPQTAAMLQPYEGSSERGMLFLDAEQIFELGQKASENGISLAIHAIGDRANFEVLKAYDQMRHYEKEHCKPHLRHRIEHVQIIHPDHINRLAELGIIASMQPIHATSDYPMADRYWGARSRTAYALGDLLERGTRMTFGSDAPVESPNPFWGLHAAVTRRRQDGSPSPEGWYPHQRLSLDQALAGYTTGPAYAAGLENRLGRIAPGYLADLIVLPEDPFELNPDQLYAVQPAATMVGGRFVWER